MKYPYRVVTATRPEVIAYARSPEHAEGSVIKYLREGAPLVRVEFRRRPLIEFVTRSEPATATEAAVRSLGSVPVIAYPDWFLANDEVGFQARVRGSTGAAEPVIPSNHIRKQVQALGDVAALPRGKNRQAAVLRLMEVCGLSQSDSIAAVLALKEFLR